MINTINFIEIVIVNGIGVLPMVLLRISRIENIEKRFFGDVVFDIMIRLTIAGCLVEIGTFVIDRKMFFGSRALSYLLNSFCFIDTCTVGFLWCLFVDFRIFNNINRIQKKAKILCIPLMVDIVMNVINLNGCGIAVRYAGDEFIVLIHTEDELFVKETMNYIQNKTEEFNQKNEEPYHLSFAMGYSRFDVKTGNVEQFLTEMDRQMYLSKQLHYQNKDKK